MSLFTNHTTSLLEMYVCADSVVKEQLNRKKSTHRERRS